MISSVIKWRLIVGELIEIKGFHVDVYSMREPMRFEEYIQKMPGSTAERINDAWVRVKRLLSLTPVHRQFVINVEAERLLPEYGWEAFVEALLSDWSLQDDVLERVSAAFAGVTHSGPIINSVSSQTLFGHAKLRTGFEAWLLKQRYVLTGKKAQEEVEQMLLCKTYPSSRFQDVRLAEFGMWATWNEDDPAQDPFPTLDKHRIVATLGLAPLRSAEDLLLFTYQLNEPEVRYPTVADAYAGKGWLRYFRPATMNSEYGMTMPHDAKGRDAYRPRPECVHEPIMGSKLVSVRLAH